MPMIWTHILFSEEEIDQTEKIVNFSLDEDYLLLGAQGDNLLEFTTFCSENKLSVNRNILKLIIKISEENFFKLIKSISYTNQNLTSFFIGYITYCSLENCLKKYIEHFVNYTDSNTNNIKTAFYTVLMHQYHNLDT